MLYDADGNLVRYGGWTYEWDGENRLILASNGATVVKNTYDSMSRRVEKAVNGSSRQFLYDGWAMIREITADGTNDYVYGLDLSGTPQSAGTIGGILARVSGSSPAFYAYDANGNVTEMVDPNGNMVSQYRYDPFGNSLLAIGGASLPNPFRFSSKYLDDETGWVYYGYRFYSPGLGRWVSRDPIMERGGLNLYVLVHNNVPNTIDVLGLTNEPPGFPDPDPSWGHCPNIPVIPLPDLGDFVPDPYTSCLDEGWFRHCYNSCLLQINLGGTPLTSWLTQCIAQLNGGDLPWQETRSEDDVAANQAGIDLANNMDPITARGCYNGCRDAFDDAVETSCCADNKLLRKDDPKCCPQK